MQCDILFEYILIRRAFVQRYFLVIISLTYGIIKKKTTLSSVLYYCLVIALLKHHSRYYYAPNTVFTIIIILFTLYAYVFGCVVYCVGK